MSDLYIHRLAALIDQAAKTNEEAFGQAASRFADSLQGGGLIHLYGYGDKVDQFRAAYAQWGAWIILLKGLTPIPFKIVTITSGFAGYNLALFVLFSIITRGARFFLLAFLLHRYGEQARHIIEKRLGLWVTIGAAVIIIGIVAALYLI